MIRTGNSTDQQRSQSVRRPEEDQYRQTLSVDQSDRCQMYQMERKTYEKSAEEQVKEADRFRLEGNEAFRVQNYGLAAKHYWKALLQLGCAFPATNGEQRALDKVKLSCHLNLAACKCHQQEWDDVLVQCRLALEVGPRSVKAFFRQGAAYMARDEHELAREALVCAREIEPRNPEVLAALRQLKDMHGLSEDHAGLDDPEASVEECRICSEVQG